MIRLFDDLSVTIAADTQRIHLGGYPLTLYSVLGVNEIMKTEAENAV